MKAVFSALGLTPGPVVEHFNVIEDIGSGQVPGFAFQRERHRHHREPEGYAEPAASLAGSSWTNSL